MKRTFVLLLVVFVAIAFACQKPVDESKEIVTTLTGKITLSGRAASDTAITAGGQTTKSDASGDYSITVFHEGSFDFKADYKSGGIIHTEKITTEENNFIKNVAL